MLLGATAPQPISVTNTSRSPVVVKSLDVTGSADMSVALDAASYSMTLAPGQTVTGVARFSPRTLGDTSGQAAMPASDGAPGTLSMTGTGFGAVLQATPRSVFVDPFITSAAPCTFRRIHELVDCVSGARRRTNVSCTSFASKTSWDCADA